MRRGPVDSIRMIAVLLAAALTTGCATPYQLHEPHFFHRGGYGDVKVAPDAFRIGFHGNLYTARERVEDFALLRAAELTLTNNSSYFAVADLTGCKSSLLDRGLGRINSDPSKPCPLVGDERDLRTTQRPELAAARPFEWGPRTKFLPDGARYYHEYYGLLIRTFPLRPDSTAVQDAELTAQRIRTKYGLNR